MRIIALGLAVFSLVAAASAQDIQKLKKTAKAPKELAVQGLVHPDRVWTKAGARAGDVLVLSKPIGSGIVLAGGGSLLRGMDERLRAEVGLPVQVVESPLTCVAEGAGRSLDELETLDRAAKAQRRSRARARR